jgi:cellulose synthase/poly-beta-1,6-N-acetylglucosamine synthase-like glycosyltransferase
MPAYNEARHVAAKLRNLARLDYPPGRLRVILACDGCSDATAAIARATLAEPGCAHLDAEVRELTPNRGKVATLNATIASVDEPVVALTDVSAMLPPDALRRAAAHFAEPGLGAVGGTYRLAAEGADGETSYWAYQRAVKRGEAALGAPLGMHGAFWAFRRAAWQPLPADTINDDFIMPMAMYLRGWRLAYDSGIEVAEAEASDRGTEARRRRRIAAGNAQQLWRMAALLHPRHGGVALAFASGKALRVAMPLLLVLAFAGALTLAPGSTFFALLAAGEALGIALALCGLALGARAPKLLAAGGYALAGHASSGIGVVRHLLKPGRGPWQRA